MLYDSHYIKEQSYSVVDRSKIVNLSKARLKLEKEAGVKESIFHVGTRYYNSGEITHYVLEMENGETIRRKYDKIKFYEHLCELAGCELWDIRDNGKHIGYIVNPVSLHQMLCKVFD